MTKKSKERDANDAALRSFLRLKKREIALFLDVDGTLIDIAPSPAEVDVPDSLRESLTRLYDMTGGALALVSGRPISDLDTLFAPLILPIAGGHGAEFRMVNGDKASRVADLPVELRQLLVSVAPEGSGLEFEDKIYSVALHYRKSPDQEARLRDHVAQCLARFPAVDAEVLLGKAMFEVKRTGVDKGGAVRKLMAYPPFTGRMPVFIGDDVTDEAAFRSLGEYGGQGFSVGKAFQGLSGTFSAPCDVRDALARLVRSQ